MRKVKIAISMDKALLDSIDARVDGSIIRSRSQAIEYFLQKGFQSQVPDTAVLLIKGAHQEFSLSKIKGISLIKKQIDFFYINGIKNLFIITQHTKNMNLLLNEISSAPISVKIFERNVNGNADALKSLSENLKQSSFVVMSGDIFNDFDLRSMIKNHAENNLLATIGLMSREKVDKYGTAVMDGDLVVDFEEKPSEARSHVVNAGIYVFKPQIFNLFDNSTSSIEKNIIPKLAKMKQLLGYFTNGEYIHLEDGEE
ncbi:MAG: sugar phosphate nucleotidyltransferase [Nanoarchaeota archaeon]|nr:sugar phosphate nucleotidyltransferase [Nanoarchaeota archaeon]